MLTCKIAKEFSETPGPRYCRQGPDSGEEFYHKILNKIFSSAYLNNEKLILDLDDTNGYMSSFLDEAIGNLVYDFGKDVVSQKLDIISNEEPGWIDVIRNKIIPEWQNHRIKGQEPTKTAKNHGKWYRLVDNILIDKVWTQPK